MDPIANPYAPGAGTPPPELAGRDELIDSAEIATSRLIAGRHAKSVLLVGVRGVGKTVLLDRLRKDAERAGFTTVRVEAPEGKSLPALLGPSLRLLLLKLSTKQKAKNLAEHGLAALKGFFSSWKLKFQDVELNLDCEPVPGLADSGDFAEDLKDVVLAVGEAAQAAGTAVAIFIDELQYVDEDQLAALVAALHIASQDQLPIVLFGAGLPQLPGRMVKAKSYAERLFDFRWIGPLAADDARSALSIPAKVEGAEFEEAALEHIVSATQGYPYFIQEWGKHCWDVADESPITEDDVERASRVVIATLDESFFRVRLERLTPAEKRYLRGMSELGPGPHRSGDIASALGVRVQTVAPTRGSLIAKGMIYSPAHGDTAFTVPLFDEFMRRVMPVMDTG